MKILIAPNAFKGSLSAQEAASAMARGAQKFGRVIQCPVADGGDGTMDVMVRALGGKIHKTRVQGPLGKKHLARWGWVPKKRLAVIEMAEASGLKILSPGQKNPLKTTTYGTGELIRAALDSGAKTIWVGLGGSATVDGGTGMAQALGIEFFDQKGRRLFVQGGGMLLKVARVSVARRDPRFGSVKILGLCDVNNPLLGPQGAARIFGPQKGASLKDVVLLEKGLNHLSRVVRRDLGRTVTGPRTGAAGGLGAGLMAFCQATLSSGAELVLKAVGFVQWLKRSDLVITGEGRLDRGTLLGKAPALVAGMAKHLGVPVAIICGTLAQEDKKLLAKYFKIYPMSQGKRTAIPSPLLARQKMAVASAEAVKVFKQKLLKGA